MSQISARKGVFWLTLIMDKAGKLIGFEVLNYLPAGESLGVETLAVEGAVLGVCAAERSWDLVVGNCSRPVPQEGSVVGKDVVFCSVLGHLVEFSARDFSCGADS